MLNRGLRGHGSSSWQGRHGGSGMKQLSGIRGMDGVFSLLLFSYSVWDTYEMVPPTFRMDALS